MYICMHIHLWQFTEKPPSTSAQWASLTLKGTAKLFVLTCFRLVRINDDESSTIHSGAKPQQQKQNSNSSICTELCHEILLQARTLRVGQTQRARWHTKKEYVFDICVLTELNCFLILSYTLTSTSTTFFFFLKVSGWHDHSPCSGFTL